MTTESKAREILAEEYKNFGIIGGVDESVSFLDRAALRAIERALAQPVVDEAMVERVGNAIAEVLGDAYDCTRVWSAWSCGTMTQDDFTPVAEDPERINELARAALTAAGMGVGCG